MKVVVAQNGSREHYLAARALHRRGMLAQLVVDWYPPKNRLGRWLAGLIPSVEVARAIGAGCEDVPDALITAMRLHGIATRMRRRHAARSGDTYPAYLKCDSTFARRVSRLDLPRHDVFFGYSYASLEALKKRNGILTVLDQIDPGLAETRRVQKEEKQWPDYVHQTLNPPSAYHARNRREWELADVIVVNSQWTHDLLKEDGAPTEKIEVLPLAYNVDRAANPGTRTYSPPLRVLWLGTVCLRKGIPYLIEAARHLEGKSVHIQIAGPLDIDPKVINTCPPNIEWLGPVPRVNASRLYRESDVFILPTISDGFAITQIEALAHGLPVIITPHCARVVEDGRHGYVVPAGDATALSQAIMHFVDAPEKLVEMRPDCIARSRDFSLDHYADGLVSILERRMAVLSEGQL